jgi:alpha-amylase/alpha-mannosidase (GH57 family)
MKRIDRLYPGSWINANFDTWIGIQEKNRAWEYLLTARNDLEASKLPRPDPRRPEPAGKSRQWFAYKAWEEMYAAEGSDWFWWYGTKQYVPGGTKPFDVAFINHLKNIYAFARQAGCSMPDRNFPSITGGTAVDTGIEQGSMKQSWNEVSANA